MTEANQQLSISGCQRRPIAPRLLKVIQIVTGYLVVRWVVWLSARYLLGYRVQTTLSLVNDRLLYQARTSLLGRDVRHVEEIYLVEDVVSMGVEKRFPHLLLLLGALGLIVGTVYGLIAVVDGIQAGYLAISVVGLSVVAAGGAF